MSDQKDLTVIEQRQVAFQGDQILAALIESEDEEQVVVPVRPICEFLGVDWPSQRKRIMRDAVLAEEAISVVITTTQGAAPQGRAMLCLPLDFLNGFLFGINASRVKEEIRDKLINYQRDCYRVLADAFLAKEMPKSGSSLMQIRDMALAIATMAEQQIMLETRMDHTESRLDKAALVVRGMQQRLSEIEQRVSPGNPISDEQASELSLRIKAIAETLSQRDPTKQHYQSLFAEIHRRFRVSSYKTIPQRKYAAVVKFLDDYWASLSEENEA